MARDVSDSTPITAKAELVGWIAEGEKPASAFRLGTEHEKFPFYRGDLAPVPYEGRADGSAGGIRHLLEGMQQRLGWEPIVDAGHIIGLAGPDGGGAISLEPGGQFELSGAPVETVHDTADELVLGAPEAPAEYRPAGAPPAAEEAPARPAGGGTLFERMSRLSRGAAAPDSDEGGKDDGVDIPRFLGRQNNQ